VLSAKWREHLSAHQVKRSNQNTCISQKAVGSGSDRVKKAQVLADGPCTDRGELALGRNLVAFLPWRGYNFEDAILVSEKLSRTITTLRFTSREYESKRATPSWSEEVTRDILTSASRSCAIGRNGVIRIGAVVKPGDILVGKVTPKARPP